MNVAVLKKNADWHRNKYYKTHDRYHFGQWKAYYRVWSSIQRPEGKLRLRDHKIEELHG